jgi:beta-mannosidase
MTLRTCIERARTRWPQCTGSLHYKLNDNFPAVSWSTVDWYGAPKIGHFVVRNAHAPLHLCVLQSRCSIRGAQQWSDVWLFDETNALDGREWRTRIRLLGPDFQVLQEAENGGSGAVKSPCGRPAFVIPWNMAEYEPLFLVADLFVEGALADRTWYFYNFEAKRGCMFDRARTTLSLAADRGIAVVGNTGSVPAMGVAVTRPGHADTFTPEEGFLWLDPGETRRIAVDSTDGLDVEALNAGGTR